MNSLIKTVGFVILLLVINVNYNMEYITTVTKDKKEFKIYKRFFSTVFKDSDDMLEDNKFEIPIKSKTFMVLLPLLDIIDETEDVNEQKIQLKNRILQENSLSVMQSIKLLNAANFINSEPLLNFFLNYFSEIILKESEESSLDNLFKAVERFDIPEELSLLIGRKIISKHSKNMINDTYAVKEIIKNKKIVALAFSSDKSLFAYAEDKNGVIIADAKTGTCIGNFAQGNEPIKDICFSGDGLTVAAVTQVKSKSIIRIFSIEEKKCFESFYLTDCAIDALSFSLNSKVLLASTGDNEIIKCNVKNVKKELSVFVFENGSVGPHVYNKKGIIVANPLLLCKKKIALWSLTNGELFKDLKKLKAEYALLFVMIAKKAASSEKFNFSKSPYAQERYNKMIQQNKSIQTCLKGHVSLGETKSCIIS